MTHAEQTPEHVIWNM